MASINPLTLPEIATAVGLFLDSSDLVRCLRVCRLWHAAFLPLVWSTIAIFQKKPYPTSDALSRHSHLVKTLSYHVDLWHNYGPIHCPNLSLLSIQSPDVITPDDISPHEHQITHLVLDNMFTFMSFHPILQQQPHYLRNLTKLELSCIAVDPDHSEDFWNFCTRLDSLLIRSTVLTVLADKSLTFARLRKLILNIVAYASLEDQLEFITQCPNLTYLEWNPDETYPQSTKDRFIAHVADGNVPSLRTLLCDDLHASDIQLSQIISNIHKVEELEVPGCDFGPLSWAALRPHLRSLKNLDIMNSPTPTTSIIPVILSSCPLLDRLRAGVVTSQDILDGQPWVCGRSLRYLFVSIILTPSQETDADRHQHHVFERMSRLVNLEELNLYNDDPMATRCLDFRLDKGLGLLATMRQLETLALGRTEQCLVDDQPLEEPPACDRVLASSRLQDAGSNVSME
ncbi:hypothetical protein BGX31_006354 [Mortierella sp. GBA43]|nr:hypothetical protein BGX31_006354 [Mortierella sp. GBA43]